MEETEQFNSYNAGKACDVVIKVFACIKIAWDRVRNMFVTVLTTSTPIWRPGFNFSGSMYQRESGNVSFLLYLYGLSYKCINYCWYRTKNES